ncbi:MAG: substrate-binding domain-containing protein [Ruminococcus sp.]
MQYKKNALTRLITAIFLPVFILCGCSISEGGSSADAQYNGKFNGETIKILSGSENKELSHILDACADDTGVTIEITYQGSVDIMHTLQDGAEEYDAVWPASSLWVSLGDTAHLVKYNTSIYTTPVVFGIRKSLAEQLGFVGTEVSVIDILEAIRKKQLSFCMTSATQSNSGANAYIGFLYALLGKTDTLTESDLESETLKRDISQLLSGIDRSSGSSDWLKDMFLAGDFDAMVNYECLIIHANQELVSQGKEPLYAVYPYDGLSIADSPLGYIDHGNAEKQDAFLAVQEYLLSEEVQNEIQKTGRRTGFEGVSEENQDIFNSDWGIDTQRLLSPITMPSEQVLTKALNLYQTEFRKPSLNVYCLDFSGSMTGQGNEQLEEAMAQILIQENAEKNMLQADKDEVNIVITFSENVRNVYTAEHADADSLRFLYEQISSETPEGGTDMYTAVKKGLEILSTYENLENYTPAIILMSDGASVTATESEFTAYYQKLGLDIPVFSIMFGDADSSQLDALAARTNARVFDGRTDLVSAFRSVKGYN